MYYAMYHEPGATLLILLYHTYQVIYRLVPGIVLRYPLSLTSRYLCTVSSSFGIGSLGRPWGLPKAISS